MAASADSSQRDGLASDNGFVRAVLALPAKPDTTVRFFERGDYYTVHGEDAALAAKELFRTREVIRILGTGAPLAGSGGCVGGPWGGGWMGERPSAVQRGLRVSELGY